YNHADMTLKEVQKDYTQESVSDNPRPIGPYYAYNDSYLEIRGGMFENFRGILTWVCLFVFLIPFHVVYIGLSIIIELVDNGSDDILSDVFVLIYCITVFIISMYLVIRYFRYIYRFELFTIRHIRVRFNRVTRQ
ncbi:hypothetical protein J3U35_05245, partial [Gilliamella sp. B2717]